MHAADCYSEGNVVDVDVMPHAVSGAHDHGHVSPETDVSVATQIPAGIDADDKSSKPETHASDREPVNAVSPTSVPAESSLSTSIAQGDNEPVLSSTKDVQPTSVSVPPNSIGELSADHFGSSDTQVSEIPSTGEEAQTATPSTIVDIDAQDTTVSEETVAAMINGEGDHQESDLEATHGDQLTEPPASLSSTSTYGDLSLAPISKPKGGKIPSANRLSISYAGGNRRLVINAEIVDALRVFRQEGRIEVDINLDKDGDDGLKGISVFLSQLSCLQTPI